MNGENINKQSRKLFFLTVPLTLVIGTYWYLNNSDRDIPELASNPMQKSISSKDEKNLNSLKKPPIVDSDYNPLLSRINSTSTSEDASPPDKKLLSKGVEKKNKPDNNVSNTISIDDIKQEGSFENNIYQNSESISKGFEKLNLLLNIKESGDGLAVGEIKQNLLDLAKQDVSALNNLISLFEANLDNQLVKDELIDILSTIKDPEVEQLGLKLVRSGEHKQILDGLNLLGQLSIPNEETLELTTQIISQNQTELDIIIPAIHAMPIIPVPEEKRSEILSELSNLAQHKSESVRSESIFAISKWAKNEQQLTPVIQALQSDTVDDRISATMALEKSPVVSTNLKETFLALMTDNNELWEIRSISANALNRFDLTSYEYSEYKSFKEKQITGAQ